MLTAFVLFFFLWVLAAALDKLDEWLRSNE